MLPLGLVFVHLRRRAGGARPQTEMDFGLLQTALGSGSPTYCVVAADCISSNSLLRPLGLTPQAARKVRSRQLERII